MGISVRAAVAQFRGLDADRNGRLTQNEMGGNKTAALVAKSAGKRSGLTEGDFRRWAQASNQAKQGSTQVRAEAWVREDAASTVNNERQRAQEVMAKPDREAALTEAKSILDQRRASRAQAQKEANTSTGQTQMNAAERAWGLRRSVKIWEQAVAKLTAPAATQQNERVGGLQQRFAEAKKQLAAANEALAPFERQAWIGPASAGAARTAMAKYLDAYRAYNKADAELHNVQSREFPPTSNDHARYWAVAVKLPRDTTPSMSAR